MPNPKTSWFHRALTLVALSLAMAETSAQVPGASAGQSAPAPGAPAAGSPAVDEAASYSVGLTFGSQLYGAGAAPELSLDAVTRGLKDGLAGKPLADEDRQRSITLLQAVRAGVAARNRAAASTFLAENGAVSGVVTTASGLQYTIVKPGDAKATSPALSDRVTVQYRGRLLDGTEFDSSERHAQAATFGVNGVIKGWREALQLMKPGAQWRLFIPPELAYGDNSPPSIPPGSLLVFDVELIRVEAPAVMTPQAPKEQKGAKPATVKPSAAPAPTGNQ